MSAYDCIVIGLGAMGSAALYHLARRGARVLGVEQFSIAHDRGSSHGQSRIIRKAYFEHPDYVPLLHSAYALWSELEQQAGRTLFDRTGLILAGRPDGEVIPGVRRAANRHNLSIESVSKTDAAERFPAFAFDPDMDVLFEPDAGYLAVEACVESHARLAHARGAESICASRAMVELAAGSDANPEQARFLVRTDQGTFETERIVLAQGAWTTDFLGVPLPLHVRRKVQLWFRPADARLHRGHGCPAFCFECPDGFFYGFPSLDGAEIKVAEHSGGQVVASPDRLDRTVHPDDALSVQRFLARHLPGVQPRPLRGAACMYTMSPDSHFIVDTHPRYPRAALAAGFSGHGFKFSSVIGRILADLVLDGTTAEPIDFLRLRRFAPA